MDCLLCRCASSSCCCCCFLLFWKRDCLWVLAIPWNVEYNLLLLQEFYCFRFRMRNPICTDFFPLVFSVVVIVIALVFRSFFSLSFRFLSLPSLFLLLLRYIYINFVVVFAVFFTLCLLCFPLFTPTNFIRFTLLHVSFMLFALTAQ